MLSDIVVSGLHCYITITSVASALVEDASTNGTYVNGVKIGKGLTLEVKDGDVLTMGKPGAGSGSISFKTEFVGMDNEPAPQPVFNNAPAPTPSANSHVFKREIEDLKVLVSQAQHRSDMSDRRAQEMGIKLSSAEGELKRMKENNVELTVRNDVMRGEIEQLRARLSVADRAVGDAEKKSDALQVKVEYMSKEFSEIAALKAAMNLKNTTLGEEIDRLRRENSELSSKTMISADVRRQLVSNLRSVQQLVSATTNICDTIGQDNANLYMRTRDRGYPYMEPSVESVPKSPEYYIGSGLEQ